VEGGRDLVPLINKLLESTKIAIKVATQDWHPKDHISFASNHPGPDNKPFESFIDMPNLVAGKPDETMKQRLWPVHCVQGTEGAEIVDGLLTEKVDVFVKKGMDSRVEMYSAFTDSFGNVTSQGVSEDLGQILRDRGISQVYVVGLAGDYCVKYTALGAVKVGGMTVSIIEDAQKGVDPSMWTSEKKKLEEAGIKFVNMDSGEIRELLSA
jgi:nicotinamidase-related amidase